MFVNYIYFKGLLYNTGIFGKTLLQY